MNFGQIREIKSLRKFSRREIRGKKASRNFQSLTIFLLLFRIFRLFIGDLSFEYIQKCIFAKLSPREKFEITNLRKLVLAKYDFFYELAKISPCEN